jgi:site-specific recombinase XerC
VVEKHVLDRNYRMKSLTVDVHAGRAFRHRRLAKSARAEDLVFQSVCRGKEMNPDNIRKRFIAPVAKESKLGKVNCRCPRTSCATWQLQAGADPKSVQGQIRHSRISTTMDIYASLFREVTSGLLQSSQSTWRTRSRSLVQLLVQ